MVNPVITPKTAEKTPVWERCLSIPGLHGKVPRYLDMEISYQDLEGKTHTHKALSSWAALLQHECDHLDGIVFPMRMTDLALLAFNDEPGPLAKEVAEDPRGIDPLFVDLVERWPGVQDGSREIRNENVVRDIRRFFRKRFRTGHPRSPRQDPARP